MKCVFCDNKHLAGYNSCFNCMWEYTRTFRYHYFDSSKRFTSRQAYLWEIRPTVEHSGFIHHPKDGYDLFHKGKLVRHGKTVKELKSYVKKEIVDE